jgi:adenylate kinase
MAPNLIMLGPPGAGKGTQAERFARARGIPRVSTGDILREAVHAGTDTGLRVKAVMDRGELVGDDVMIGIVRERLDQPDARKGFVLEGFPRTVAQATALDVIVAGRPPLIIVDIVVPESELVRRLSFRLICADCGTTATPGTSGAPVSCTTCGGRLIQRADDTDAVVLERLGVYRRDTKPLVEYYRPRPTFCSIDGAQAPDRVTADIASEVEGAIRRGFRAAEGRTR